MTTKPSTRVPSVHRLRLAGVASLALGALVFSPLSVPTAQADPAPEAADTVLGVGDFSVTPAAGSCSAVVTLEGGNGGTAVSGGADDDNPDPDDPDQIGGGQGARIRFTVPVAPGDVLSGVVGNGGSNAGIGGASGNDPLTADHGGDGGTGTHRGGGGAGYTSFMLNGTLIALAGGGGGSGGGHNPNAGGGGHAGVVDGVGTWAGQEGANGTDLDSVATPDPANPGQNLLSGGPGGGGAGATAAPGTGGVHPITPAYNGSDGAGRNGGEGGHDGSADQGGGGGAGYHGAGGGASTNGNVSGGNPIRLIIGGGGGGGASYFQNAGGADFIAPPANSGEGLAPNGAQRKGTAEIDWVPCNYDLSVTKTASSKSFEAGVPVTFTVTVKNEGPEAMGIGDTVSLLDANAAGATLVKVASSSATDPQITCDVVSGGTMVTGGLECSRPIGGGADVRGLNLGEKLVITYKQAFTGTAPVVNTVSVTDRGNQANNSAAAGLSVAKPGLKLTKTANRKKVTRVRQAVTYTFRVRNTGNVALRNVRIVEGNFSGKGHLKPRCAKLPNNELAPGKVLICKVVYRVTRADLRRGTIINTASAQALTPGAQPLVSNNATAKVKTRKSVPGAPNTGGRAR